MDCTLEMFFELNTNKTNLKGNKNDANSAKLKRKQPEH